MEYGGACTVRPHVAIGSKETPDLGLVGIELRKRQVRVLRYFPIYSGKRVRERAILSALQIEKVEVERDTVWKCKLSPRDQLRTHLAGSNGTGFAARLYPTL